MTSVNVPAVGLTVLVRGQRGTVKYVGKTQFAPGTWIGVELHTPTGKNNGSVNDVKYFECSKADGNYGIFVRPSLISIDSQTPSPPPPPPPTSDLHRIIEKLQTKLKATTEDIKQYKQTIYDLRNDLSQLQASASKLESSLEMVSTDKSFLVEQNQQLSSDLDHLQSTYEELKIDHDIIKEELELNKQLEDAIKKSHPDEVSHDDYDLILLRNSKLELALLNLKSLSDEKTTNLENQITALKTEIAHKDEKLLTFDSILSKLHTADLTIETLQSQLESALELERIIEHLTSENEELNIRVAKLNTTIDELTELHDLEKNYEESQSQIEQNLRNDINALLTIIQKDKSAINDLEKKNKYLENKFLEYKQSLTQAINRVSDVDDTKSTMDWQLEALQLELKKKTASSFSDKISLRVARTKLDLLQKFDSSSISGSGNLKQGYEMVYNINLNIAYTTIIIEVLGDYHPDTEVQYSSLVSIRLNLLHLLTYLEAVAHLWEYNYATKHYMNIMFAFKTIINELNHHLLLLIDNVVDGNLDESLATSYFKGFITEGSDLLKLNFVNDSYTIIFQNISIFKILVTNVTNESKEVINVIIFMLKFLDQYSDGDNDALKEVYQELSIIKKSVNDIHAKSQEILDGLINDCLSSKDLTITVNREFSLSEFGETFKSFFRILKKVELETYSIMDTELVLEPLILKELFEFDDEVESWETLHSIESSLQETRLFLDAEFDIYEKHTQSIYDAVHDISAVDPPREVNVDHHRKLSMELKNSDLTSKILQKDGRIQDLQLNVRLLERNMASSDAKSKEQIDKLKKELSNLNKDHETMKNNYESLLKANKDLEVEIKEIMKANQTYESSQLISKFKDLSSDKKHTAEMALIEEVLLLRKMVDAKYSQFTSPSHDLRNSDDLKWLELPILQSSPSRLNGNQDSFKSSGTRLRSLTNEALPVQLPDRRGAWKPKASTPKFINALMEEKRKQYQRERGSSILSSFN